MSESEIKIDVAKMRNIASEMNKIHKSYASCLSQATKETQKIKGYWQGEASTSFVSSYEVLNSKCNEFLITLNKTASVLYDVADTYEKSEKAIESKAADLPSLPANTME